MGIPRQVFFETLTEIAQKDPSIIVLDADVARSTGSGIFREEFPDRFVSVGVAEQNLLGVAAGISLVDKKPYASAFAVFAAERPFEIIRNTIAYSQLNVKIVATHAGVGVGPDGASHQANEDIGILRVLPNMTIVVPSDAAMAKAVASESVYYEGPMYIRLGRSAVPDLPPVVKFRIGRAVLRREGSDVGIVTCGVAVKAAIDVSEALASEGIGVAVMEMPTIKPLDVKATVKLAKSVKFLVSVEEHSIIGGLGSALAECLSSKCPISLFRIGIPDEFSESGSMDELLKKNCLTGDTLLPRIMEFMEIWRMNKKEKDVGNITIDSPV